MSIAPIPSSYYKLKNLYDNFIDLSNNKGIDNINQLDIYSITTGCNEVATLFTITTDPSGMKVYTRTYTSVPMNYDNISPGKYAINTTLSTTGPAYNALINGNSYQGIINLFGTNYLGYYWPIGSNYAVLIAIDA